MKHARKRRTYPVKNLRASTGVRIQDLVDEMSASESYISQAERGLVQPTKDWWERYAAALSKLSGKAFTVARIANLLGPGAVVA